LIQIIGPVTAILTTRLNHILKGSGGQRNTAMIAGRNLISFDTIKTRLAQNVGKTLAEGTAAMTADFGKENIEEKISKCAELSHNLI
jgi:hypothetical protein